MTKTCLQTGLAALVLLFVGDVFGQDAPAPYLIVDFMKSTSDDYTEVESTVWKPMHQDRVDRGQLVSWSLYSVRYGDRTTYDHATVNVYPTVASTQGSYDDLADLFARVHPGVNMDEAMAKTTASRQAVRTELWRGVLFEGEPGPYRYASIAYMKVPPGGGANYVEVERKWHAPLRRAAIEKGCQGAWGIYSLSSPYGTDQQYNYAAVNFTDDWDHDCDYNAIMSQVHPDVTVDAILEETMASRDMVHGIEWTLIESVARAAE